MLPPVENVAHAACVPLALAQGLDLRGARARVIAERGAAKPAVEPDFDDEDEQPAQQSGLRPSVQHTIGAAPSALALLPALPHRSVALRPLLAPFSARSGCVACTPCVLVILLNKDRVSRRQGFSSVVAHCRR